MIRSQGHRASMRSAIGGCRLSFRAEHQVTTPMLDPGVCRGSSAPAWLKQNRLRRGIKPRIYCPTVRGKKNAMRGRNGLAMMLSLDRAFRQRRELRPVSEQERLFAGAGATGDAGLLGVGSIGQENPSRRRVRPERSLVDRASTDARATPEEDARELARSGVTLGQIELRRHRGVAAKEDILSRHRRAKGTHRDIVNADLLAG